MYIAQIKINNDIIFPFFKHVLKYKAHLIKETEQSLKYIQRVIEGFQRRWPSKTREFI